MMKKIHIFAAALALPILSTPALAIDAGEVAEYWTVAMGRAGKIVDSMDIADATVREALQEAVAGQYRDLYIVYGLRDEALDNLKGKEFGMNQFQESARAGIEDAARKEVERLHRQFVGRLVALVGPEGASAVKDGLTYNVAPNTYKVYVEMLPDLADADKMKIKAWLYEAREYAMDGGSSDEKHGWFGKYKGRINNYLSTELGIDLKQAEKDMFDRMKKEKEQGHD